MSSHAPIDRSSAAVETFASRIERESWCQLFLSMLTQLNAQAAFPSYNVVLALWGVYCGHARNGRALLGHIIFLGISIVCDIVFCALWSSNEHGDDRLYDFCLAMLCFNIVAKFVAIFHALHLFALLGGSQSLDPRQVQGMYSKR